MQGGKGEGNGWKTRRIRRRKDKNEPREGDGLRGEE